MGRPLGRVSCRAICIKWMSCESCRLYEKVLGADWHVCRAKLQSNLSGIKLVTGAAVEGIPGESI